MKTTQIIAIVTALFTAGFAASAADADAVASPSVPAPAVADTNVTGAGFPTNGIVLNFHEVPLNTVLNYLSAKAGLIIVSDANLQGNVSVVAKQPIGTNEIVDLLNEQLAKNNLGAVLQGRTLQIMDNERMKSLATTPVKYATNGPDSVLNTDAIVTEILPVMSLNPAQLVKDLDSLIPKNATVSANDAGGAIIMTAPGRDIHRVSEIISALDSSSVSDVEVFVLRYGDAKAVAAELKEVFQSADSDVTRASARNSFGRGGRGGGFPGGFGGFGGGGGGGGNNNGEESKNAQTKAVFVSDDQMNAVVASAPPSYMPFVSNVIAQLDQPSQDITEIKVFKLKHADPAEIATELGDLFPSTTSSDQNNRNMGFRFAPWMQQNNNANNKSERMKQQSSVLAVADRRTESVIVTASKDLMGEIKGMIEALDDGTAGMTHVTAIHLDSADPASVELTINGLFNNTGSASSTTTTTALSARAQGNNQNQSSSATTSTGSGFGSTGGAAAIH